MSIGYWLGGRAGSSRPATLIAVLLNAAALLLIVPWLDALISPAIAASKFELATHAFPATSILARRSGDLVIGASTTDRYGECHTSTHGHGGVLRRVSRHLMAGEIMRATWRW